MGFCTYAPYSKGRGKGAVIVSWIGTGTDHGCSRYVTYNKSARLSACTKSPCHTSPNCPACNGDKSLKCADVARQFRKMIANGKDQRGNPLKCKSSGYGSKTHSLDIVGNIVDLLSGKRNTDADRNTGGSTSTGGDPTKEQEKQKQEEQEEKLRECERKKCGNFFTDFGCYSWKLQNGCPGSTQLTDIIPDLCKDFPPPLNNCLLVGGLAVGAVVLIMLLK